MPLQAIIAAMDTELSQCNAAEGSVHTTDAGKIAALPGKGTAMPCSYDNSDDGMVAADIKEISFGHTPDADDAFMWFGLSAHKILTPKLKINHILKSMQELNVEAQEGVHEISAISFGAYPYVANHYALAPCGGCFGFNYGPMLLSSKPLSHAELLQSTIAIPGKLTSAYLALRLFEPRLKTIELPFNEIVPAIKNHSVDAGLVIHEAQLTYKKMGFFKIVDLGEWWHKETNLPLPLGGNIIRKDLSAKAKLLLAKLMQDSIRYSLEHRPEALKFAMQWARGIPEEEANKFIGMYVNETTIDYGDQGRKAITKFYELAFERGVLEEKVVPEFIQL